MEETIHQVFIKFKPDKDLCDIPVFDSKVKKTQEYCEKYNISYKLWREDDIDELLTKYPEYRKFYNEFRHPIQKVDFIRYLILYDQGGIYVDCDVCPIGDVSYLFEMNEFFVKWNNEKKDLPYIAVLGSKSKNPLYEDIFKEIIVSVYTRENSETFKRWVCRYVFQTTGHFMLQRVLKKHKGVKILDILKINKYGGRVISGPCPVFEDENAAVWWNRNGNDKHTKVLVE